MKILGLFLFIAFVDLAYAKTSTLLLRGRVPASSSLSDVTLNDGSTLKVRAKRHEFTIKQHQSEKMKYVDIIFH
jgi:hypothetical protein